MPSVSVGSSAMSRCLSPLLSGLGTVMALTFVGAMFALPGVNIYFPLRTWILCLGVTFLVSIIYYFSIKRIFYIAIFNSIMITTSCSLWALYFIYIASFGTPWGLGALIALSICAGMIWVGWHGYKSTMSSPEREVMPHDFCGTLDVETGLVDTRVTPAMAYQRLVRAKPVPGWIRYLPIAALSLWLVRLLPMRGDIVLAAICAGVFAFFFVYAAGARWAFVVTSRRWEKANGKRMYKK